MKNSIKYITLIILVTCVSSCKKYLETTPDLRASLNTPAKVSELLATAYPHANYIPFTEGMSDNVDDKGGAAGGGDIINRDPWLFQDVANRDEDTPDFYWYGCYTAIAAANQALEAIEKAEDPSQYKSQKGEALLARAYSHFMLVTLFSKVYNVATAGSDPGIPYVIAPEKVVINKYERKTVAYVYEQIEKDLTAGLPLINGSSYTVPKFHFTPAAAHAFATRFYLFKKDYAKVVEHANLVFAGGNLVANLRDYVAPSFRIMEPRIMSNYWSDSANPANILLQEAKSWWGRNFGNNRYSLTMNLIRQTLWKAPVSGGSWAYQVYGRDLSLNLRKFPEHFVLTTQGGTTGEGYNMIPLFSTEEVLFNRAEANVYLNNYTAALKDLNDFGSKRIIISDSNPVYSPTAHEINEAKIKKFYNTNSLRDGLIKTILDFKRTDFMFEGMRWFDILRYDLPVVHTSADLKTSYILGPNDPRRVFQIPKEAEATGIERNPR